MYTIMKKCLKWLLVIGWSITFLLACQSTGLVPVPPTSETPVEFEQAIRTLANNLMATLANLSTSESAMVVFNPVVDMDSGKSAITVSVDIEKLFFEETRKKFKKFKIDRITQGNLKKADYVVNSIIEYKFRPSQQSRKYYQIGSTILDWKSKIIVAKGNVWIEKEKLDFTPVGSDKANPMYVKGLMLKRLIDIVSSPVDTQVSGDSIEFIEIKALLAEAQTAAEHDHDEEALRLYQEVIQRSNDKIMGARGGEHAIYFKQEKFDKAEESFYKMVEIGVAEIGIIPIKFHFVSSSTNFYPTMEKLSTLWLKQLSLYFKNNPEKCVEIVGHTSKSAPPDKPDFNQKLSEARAKAIQDKMSKIFPEITKRSKAIGKGSSETLVGTEPDSDSNAIDRRVEFKVKWCSDLK